MARSALRKGVRVPSPDPVVGFILVRMYLVPVRPARATLAAPNPVLSAGLRRAANRVGLEVVAVGEGADLSIRTATSGLPHPDLDIVINESSTVVTAKLPTEPAIWDTVRRFLEEIDEGSTTLQPHRDPEDDGDDTPRVGDR